jgi:hypothetical protein
MYPDLIKKLADQLIAERLRDAEGIPRLESKPPLAAQPMPLAQRLNQPKPICELGRQRPTTPSALRSAHVRSHRRERVTRRR